MRSSSRANARPASDIGRSRLVGGQLERYIAFGPDGLDMFLELR